MNGLKLLIIAEFNKIDFHPDNVSNVEIGYVFEELIRRFLENDAADDYYTPHEVTKLMVNLVFVKMEKS